MEIKSDKSKHRSAKIAGGVIFIIAGLLMLGRNMGLNIPHWLVSWPLLLIALGVVAGIRHNFRKPGAYIMILIGSLFMLDKMLPGFEAGNVIFPAIITTLGLFMILKKDDHPFAGRCGKWHHYKKMQSNS